MKPALAVLAVLVVPGVGAAVSSSVALAPTSGVAGEGGVVSYQKTSTLVADGWQNGTVTLRVTGPANLTLAALPYHFAATLPFYASTVSLAWTWTPNLSGNYTLTFTDHPTQGPARNQTASYHVAPASEAGGGGVVVHPRLRVGVVADLILVAAVVLLVVIARRAPRGLKATAFAVAALVLLVLFVLACRSVQA